MGRGGRPKRWPRSWKQAARAGGPFVLKGRGFEREYVGLSVRVEADTPERLVETVDDALVAATRGQRPS
jgi:hypothetical protein